jgi:hypothetical protein
MTKVELEVKLEALQKLLEEKANEQASYASQIRDLEKQISDLNKPKLTPLQFDELRDAIEIGIGNYDFSDTDCYSIDFGIDYDGRVHCESFDFDNADDLGHEIYERVARMFAEAECPDEDDNQLNQD